MFPVPDRRAANQPLPAMIFQPADWSIIAWGAGQFGGDPLAGQFRLPNRVGR
jgi:hypothetical protein